MRFSKQSTTLILAVIMATSSIAVSTTAQAKADNSHSSCQKYGKAHKGKWHSKKWHSKISPEKRQARQERRIKKLAKKLALSDNQVAQLKQIYKENNLQKQVLRENMRTLHKELQQKRKDGATFYELEVTHDQLDAVKKQVRKLRYDQAQEVKAILTDTQQAKLKKMAQNHGKHYYTFMILK